jgi:MacB-like periplasmic core domain
MLRERITDAKLKLRALVHRRQLDRDLEDELEFHLATREEKIRHKTAARDEARDSARRFFGNPILLKERCRELWTFVSLETLCQDVRYALRILRASPAFTLVAILSLALGIGANTAIFSLIDAILLRELPVHNPGELVEVMAANRNGDNAGMSIPMLEEFEGRQQVFRSMFAWAQHSIVNVETGKAFTRTDLWGADGNFHAGLGARPLLGRLITPTDVNLHGGAPAQVAVLGYDFWRNQLDGDPSAHGSTIRIEDLPFEVIGVTRGDFTGLRADTELTVTIPITALPLVSGQPLDRVYDRSFSGCHRPAQRWLHSRAGRGATRESVAGGSGRDGPAGRFSLRPPAIFFESPRCQIRGQRLYSAAQTFRRTPVRSDWHCRARSADCLREPRELACLARGGTSP